HHRRRPGRRPAARRDRGAAGRQRGRAAVNSPQSLTRWWWVRHAPVIGQDGRLYGSLDVDCDCSDKARLRALAARLPADAVWVISPLKRTRQTAAALARHHPDRPDDLLVEPSLAEQDFG